MKIIPLALTMRLMGHSWGNVVCHRGIEAKRFDSFVLCDMSSLITKECGWISKQSSRKAVFFEVSCQETWYYFLEF